MGKDLGTYHVRVTLQDGRRFISKWETGARFSHGRGHDSPVEASFIQPTWDDEGDLLAGVLYMFTQGNYSCDCNLESFYANATQAEAKDFPCGRTLRARKLEILRPNAGSVFEPFWIRELEH